MSNLVMESRSKQEIQNIRKAGKIIAACHQAIERRIAPGVTTFEIDRFAERFMLERGAYPAQKGYRGYPYAICTSVNDVVCHGFPDKEPLSAGDIVTIEMVADCDGWKADMAWTYAIGAPSKETSRLLRATKHALRKGIAECRPGKRLSDVGHVILRCAEKAGFQVITSIAGQGVGGFIHEPSRTDSRVAEGLVGLDDQLKEGMVITVEPLLTTGHGNVHIAQDGWTARTNDGCVAAMLAHTIVIGDTVPVILTV